MKILFVYKGRYQIRDATIIEYLSAISKEYGHDTDLIYEQDIFGVTDNIISVPFFNKVFSRDEDIINAIVKKNPDIVVFLYGFSRSHWNDKIAKKIKRISNEIVAIGLFYPVKNIKANEDYDYILIGEPELSFKEFISGRIYNKSERIYRFPGLCDLNKLPLPDKELFSAYINFKDSYLVYASKGCPYRCSYCEETWYKQKLGKGYFRRRSIDNVIRELLQAKKKFDIREVIYKDSVFTWDKEWLKSYLKEYKSKIDLPYKCFSTAEVFDDEIADILKKTKCYCVEFGVQTFNEKLKRHILKRYETINVLKKAFSICDKHKLRYDIDHLFGIPGEKVTDHIEAGKIYMKLRYINRIKCHNLVYYRESDIFEYAPGDVKKNEDYKAGFFSTISGDNKMLKINKNFQKYYKMMPLLPQRVNVFILKKNHWKSFAYIPYIFIFLAMIILAIKNKDKRFKIYLKYYPHKLNMSFLKRLTVSGSR